MHDQRDLRDQPFHYGRRHGIADPGRLDRHGALTALGESRSAELNVAERQARHLERHARSRNQRKLLGHGASALRNDIEAESISRHLSNRDAGHTDVRDMVVGRR
jgi:hypothetical protein